uniref:Uncharacterized protein n=1 Tax=Cyphia belfastica TaxID=2041114 RepID=A0A291F2Y1_9ASTR|nr:hypothetical protein Cyp_bel1Pt0175 [Cyphia belfastica]ATG26494.1 hypothetical protein Cyp_bel1Pt0175 [Cyphia belfastica]
MQKVYSFEYIVIYAVYSYKYLITGFNMSLLKYENDFLSKERGLLWDINRQLAHELLVQIDSQEENFFQTEEEFQLFHKKFLELQAKYTLSQELFFFIENKEKSNHRMLPYLVRDMLISQRDLEDLSDIYADKCKSNSIAKELDLQLIRWLEKPVKKLRVNLYTAVDNIARSYFQFFSLFILMDIFIRML